LLQMKRFAELKKMSEIDLLHEAVDLPRNVEVLLA